MNYRRILTFVISFLIVLPAGAAPPDKEISRQESASPNTLDLDTYIDANRILMFVTNNGILGRDLDDIFGYDAGTWWPYAGDTSFISNNINNALYESPLWSSGLWLGGVDSASGELRIAIAEYSSEYSPGPMQGGSFLPDDESFRVYKLHNDSLGDNPNEDYLNWPIDQGAPIDSAGNPEMMGRQMLWTVFNDANPAAHSNNAGETEPLGVEVQQTVWAFYEDGIDASYFPLWVNTTQHGATDAEVLVLIVDSAAVTGHDYMVVIDTSETIVGPPAMSWRLIDVTLDEILLDDRPLAVWDTADGLAVHVEGTMALFNSFAVVSNAAGPIDPPEAGALWFKGFPVPTEADSTGNGYITDEQQVSDGKWAFHTADNGGTLGGGTLGRYESFLSRVTRDGANNELIGFYDFEMRFTGHSPNPDLGGSYAIEWYNDDNVFWVPFELWRTGVGTPDDPGDDVRLVPYVYDIWGDCSTQPGDDQFVLESFGTPGTDSCWGDGEHSASGGDNDPWTDRVYWMLPTDDSPGDAGYLANEADMRAGTFDGSLIAGEIMARTVLISYNGPDWHTWYSQMCPEQGTIFRITTQKSIPKDTFTFTPAVTAYSLDTLKSSSLYIRYLLHNEGNNTIENMYVGFWSDPDLGQAGDDLVGCDTLNDIWFCYNGDNFDTEYLYFPPALGYKLIYGPVVPAPGETAFFNGHTVADHMNLPMTAFSIYIGGMDPDNASQTYNFLQGLTKSGAPYIYDGRELTYVRSGDPVIGTGDIDIAPDDRRMTACMGPFDFRPGDSQFVMLKMSMGRGPDNVNSITAVKAVLNEEFDPMTIDTVTPPPPPQLPSQFWISQNYPNPFNPTTTIEYYVPQQSRVIIEIYNILGQKVRRLLDRTMTAGVHDVVWDGTGQSGEVLATGLYFYQVRAGDFEQSKKMLLLK